jgi:hypothetical protein
LHHFVAPGVKEAPLETELLIRADMLVGDSDAVLVRSLSPFLGIDVSSILTLQRRRPIQSDAGKK